MPGGIFKVKFYIDFCKNIWLIILPIGEDVIFWGEFFPEFSLTNFRIKIPRLNFKNGDSANFEGESLFTWALGISFLIFASGSFLLESGLIFKIESIRS